MLKLDYESTITKLAIEVSMYYLCMSTSMVGDGSDKGQSWWLTKNKVNTIGKLATTTHRSFFLTNSNLQVVEMETTLLEEVKNCLAWR